MIIRIPLKILNKSNKKFISNHLIFFSLKQIKFSLYAFGKNFNGLFIKSFLDGNNDFLLKKNNKILE